MQGRVLQVSEQMVRLQKELEQKKTQVEALQREREDLRLLTACQEQRLTQTHRDMEQARAELASLENILDTLHLREVQRSHNVIWTALVLRSCYRNKP